MTPDPVQLETLAVMYWKYLENNNDLSRAIRTPRSAYTTPRGVYIKNRPIGIGEILRRKVGFFEVVTPLFTRGVVFARDSPLLLSLYGIKPHITGKSLIL